MIYGLFGLVATNIDTSRVFSRNLRKSLLSLSCKHTMSCVSYLSRIIWDTKKGRHNVVGNVFIVTYPLFGIKTPFCGFTFVRSLHFCFPVELFFVKSLGGLPSWNNLHTIPLCIVFLEWPPCKCFHGFLSINPLMEWPNVNPLWKPFMEWPLEMAYV